MPKLLTKSKYMIGLVCPHHLWLAVNDKSAISEASAAEQFRMDQGMVVGKFVMELYPQGEEVVWGDFGDMLEVTKRLIKDRKIIFEAQILHDRLLAKPDVLIPVGKDEWDVVEAKATSSVKSDHIEDVAFQKYAYEKAGLKIRKCHLCHINPDFVRDGEIDPKKFFMVEDITSEVEEIDQKEIAKWIKEMLRIIDLKSPEDLGEGPHCATPKDCGSGCCWDFLPPHNVFQLVRGGAKSIHLFNEGILAIEEIPDDFNLTSNQEVQRRATKSGKPYVDKERIKDFLKTLQYPLYYMDFETFSTAIPLYDGCKPYQQIPFQFSVHEVDSSGNVKHHEFLAERLDDPRPEFCKRLKKALGSEGSVIVYHQSFEKGRLHELADVYPEHKDWILAAINRFVDLEDPFRNFWYYDPLQEGRSSIKKVLPALTGKGYDDLEISDGGMASVAFLMLERMDEKSREKNRSDLLEYCCLDTKGMVWIVDKLEKII